MAGSKFHKNRLNDRKSALSSKIILLRELKLIEDHYSFLICKIVKGELICIGKIKPTEYSEEFEIKIVYDGISNPKIFILNPFIEYNDDIHMYPEDNSLCLYHKSDLIWNFRKHNLYDTIIPWTIEWFVFYELYLFSGKWEHPFVPHKRLKE